MEVKRGAGTYEAPCILGRVLDSAFMQARVRLSYSDSLIYTGLHTFRRHASPPRAAADGVDRTLVRSPRADFFSKIIQKSSGQILPSGPLRKNLSSGVRNAKQVRKRNLTCFLYHFKVTSSKLNVQKFIRSNADLHRVFVRILDSGPFQEI